MSNSEKLKRQKTMKVEVGKWKESGIKIDHYCKQHNLKPTTFRYWIAKNASEGPFPKQTLVKIPYTAVPLSLSQVDPINKDNEESSIKLKTTSYELEIGDKFQPITLEKILHTIRQVECNFQPQD